MYPSHKFIRFPTWQAWGAAVNPGKYTATKRATSLTRRANLPGWLSCTKSGDIFKLLKNLHTFIPSLMS